MIICIEGPDFSGKSTHVKMLADYLATQYPNMNIHPIHFPTTKTEKYMKEIITPEQDRVINNPMFVANAFLSDMYMKMNNEPHIVYPRDKMSNKATIREINYAHPTEHIFILDRYYYSTLVMCSLYNKNIVDRLKEADKIQEYWNRIQGIIIMMIKEYQLPVPDLNIVLLPSWDSIISRVQESKRTDKDVFDNKQILSQTFSLYVNAISYTSLFNMNGEPLPPFIIKDARVSQLYNQNDSGNSLSSDLIQLISENSDIRSIDSIQNDIRSIVVNYFSFRQKIFSKTYTSKDAEKMWETNLKNEDVRFYNKEDIKDFNRENDTPVVDSSQTVENFDKEEVENEETVDHQQEESSQTFFNSEKSNQILMYLNNLDIEYVAEIKSMYELDDYEMYIYDTMKMSANAIMKDPDRFVLSNSYKFEERMTVLRIILKILASYKTEKDFPKAKIDQITRYIKSKFEALSVKNKYKTKS